VAERSEATEQVVAERSEATEQVVAERSEATRVKGGGAIEVPPKK